MTDLIADVAADRAARLRWIAEQHGADEGALEPDWVIRDAQLDDSPFHGDFNWNVDQAAWEAWRERARHIIASCRLSIREESVTLNSVRYVRDPRADGNRQGYLAVDVARTDPALAGDVLAMECRQLRGYLRRVRELAGTLKLERRYAVLLRAMDALLAAIEAMTSKTKQAA